VRVTPTPRSTAAAAAPASTRSAAWSTPLAGATVQINTWVTHYTLKTGKDGSYDLLLGVRNDPLTLIVAKDGYQPTATTVKIAEGETTTSDFTLLKD
jgi:hypothetical protein